MTDAKRMVTGFNLNVKHRGKVYHVQTEDSGLGSPHIITHLFLGGNILASKKTSYADIVGAENLAQVVRELMEEQHKEMLRNLINGVYDPAEQASEAVARHYQPGQLDRAGRAPADPPARPKPPAPPGPAARTRAPPPLPAGPRPQPWRADAETVIGEDLISEKTLDEVILSYLAEDLGEKK